MNKVLKVTLCYVISVVCFFLMPMQAFAVPEVEAPSYLVMEAFPEWYYWYSGYWIKGSTGAEYEYPAFRLYYRPAE